MFKARSFCTTLKMIECHELVTVLDDGRFYEIAKEPSEPQVPRRGSGGRVRMTEKVMNGHCPAETEPKRYPSPPFWIILCTYLSYLVLMVFGYLSEFLRRMGLEESRAAVEKDRPGYAPLYQNFESFSRRNMYRRVCDCWNKPIAGVPGAFVHIKERVSDDNNWHFRLPGPTIRALNMGSYNYLGFAETDGPCAEAVRSAVRRCGAGVGSARAELGTLDIHRELERFIAWYTGTEDSLVVGMGFATNSTCIPSLVGPGCLILSDELNHSSLILGCRLSGAKVRTFRHNDMVHLEQRLSDAVTEGKEKAWRKILIIVEGIYSMEGTIINLPGVIRLKKRFKAYLYLDEAHSIGSVGPTGRGVIDYYGCDPADVDVTMGTFTKSFAAAGGFVAGSRKLVDHLRRTSHSFCYGTSMAAPIAQQVLEAGRVITGLKGGLEGTRRVQRLARNVRYFRRKLTQMGFIIYGSADSPVVPLLIYLPSKVAAFVRDMERRGVATVGVGFPATSLLESRARFCLSAAHDQEMLDLALEAVDQVGDMLGLKHFASATNQQEVIEY